MKILFIGARLFDEVAFHAKENGIETILSESNPDSLNLKLADKFFVVSRGMDRPIEIALSEDVDAVVPLIGIDKPLLEVAKMKETLENDYGLPVVASGLTATEIAGDKLKTKRFLWENNIKTPNFLEISRKQYNGRLDNNKYQLNFPSVLKQPEGQGGSGIRIVLSENEAEDYFTEYDNALAEKFIKGIEVSVEVLSWNGQSIALVPVCKGETTLECLHPLRKIRTAPANVDYLDNQQLRKLAERIVDKMGASGTIEVEFIFDTITNELNVIEMNTRPSGTRYLTLTASSINPLHELVNMGIGLWNKSDILKNMEEYAALEMPLPIHRKKEINDIFSKDKEQYINNDLNLNNNLKSNLDSNQKYELFTPDRSWIVHGPEIAQRITIRAENNAKTIEIAKKLKIME